MIILAVDPGTECSAWCLFDTYAGRPLNFGQDPNPVVLEMLLNDAYGHGPRHPPLIVEMFKNYGQIMGDSVLQTCVWIGRFIQAWPGPNHLIPRKTVVTELTGNPRSNDSNIRAYLIDRWGGKRAAIGNKAQPGPLYEVRSDIWSALAIACAWSDLHERLENTLK